MRIQIFSFLTFLCPALTFTFAQEGATKKEVVQDPLVTAESDYFLTDFHFADGESLPELKLHYRTIGQLARNPSTGQVQNAILLPGETCFGAASSPRQFGPTPNGKTAIIVDRRHRWRGSFRSSK
jgi:hypothetical protein